MISHSEPAIATWEITLETGGPTDTVWRSRLLEAARPAIEAHLCKAPTATEVRLPAGPFTLAAKRREGTWQKGTSLRLLCAPDMPSLTTAQRQHPESGDLTIQALPDPALDLLAKELVGLEAILTSVLLWLGCADGRLAQEWSTKTGAALPTAFTRHLTRRIPALMFEGDPGTGKTSLAKVIAQRLACLTGRSGQILSLRASVRGGGKVGEFSQRLQAAADMVRTLPESEWRVLLIDEAEAVGMARSEANSHHEDRAGTSCLLQILDSLSGVKNLLVILTTNQLDQLDAAVRRRCKVYSFPRPDLTARRALLARWLPDMERRALDHAARISDGMTAADLERALEQVHLEAIAATTPITATRLVACLRATPRTRRV